MKPWNVDLQKTVLVDYNPKIVFKGSLACCSEIVLTKKGNTIRKFWRTYLCFGVWIVLVLLCALPLANKLIFVSSAHSDTNKYNESSWGDINFEEILVEEENLDHLSLEVDVVEVDHPDQTIEIVRSKEATLEEKVQAKLEKAEQEKDLKPITHGATSQRYAKAKRKFLHGDVSGAKELLEQEKLSIDEKTLLSEIYVLQCRNRAFDKEYTKALIECEKAQRLTQHERAAKFLVEMETQAKNLYFEGYALEKVYPNQAVEKYMEAMASSPSFSSWKKKSMDRIKKIQM